MAGRKFDAGGFDGGNRGGDCTPSRFARYRQQVLAGTGARASADCPPSRQRRVGGWFIDSATLFEQRHPNLGHPTAVRDS